MTVAPTQTGEEVVVVVGGGGREGFHVGQREPTGDFGGLSAALRSLERSV